MDANRSDRDVTQHINRKKKKKNHIITSIDAETVFEKLDIHS